MSFFELGQPPNLFRLAFAALASMLAPWLTSQATLPINKMSLPASVDHPLPASPKPVVWATCLAMRSDGSREPQKHKYHLCCDEDSSLVVARWFNGITRGP